MTITIESGSLGVIYTKDNISEELSAKIQALIKKEEKPKKVRKPVLPYVELGDADFGNDIFDDDGELDFDMISDVLKDSDYISWSDRTGEKDNAKPFRILINNKYLIEYEVGRGDCIEATWDHRIWEAVCMNMKLLSVDENVKDVKKREPIIAEEPKPSVLAEDEILFMGDVSKVLNSYENPFRLKGGGKYWKDDTAHATKEPWANIELKNGTLVYGVKELKNVLIYKLEPESEDYYLSPMKNWYEEVK